MTTLKLRGGLEATAPTGAARELLTTTDTLKLLVGNGSINTHVGGFDRVAKTGAYTVVATDRSKIIDCTANTFTVSVTAAATLKSGFCFGVFNSGSGTITVDADGSETFRDPDGAHTTLTLTQGMGVLIECDGTNFAVIASNSGGGSGGLSDGDYGDVTVSGTGTIITIDDEAVTYAKMQNVSATDKILGRVTAGAGDVEEITFTDQAQQLADDTSFADMRTTLGLGTGDSPQFTAVNLGHASDTTITRVSAGVIAVEGATVYTQGGALGTPASGTLTNCTGLPTAGLVDDAVTYAKIQNVSATDRLLGRDTAGAGNIEELTVGGGIEFTGSGGIQTGAFTGDATKAAGGTATTVVSASKSFAFTGDVSDTLLADQNDYNPTGLADASVLRLTPSGATRTLTGLAGGADGRIITIINVSTSQELVLALDSASSTAANRFRFPGSASLTLSPSACAPLIYDATTSRWRLVGPNAVSQLGPNDLLGNPTGSSGAGVSVGLGTGLAMSGGDLVISNGAITYAKMQDVSAASRLIGRGDSGSGDPEELTLGSGLTMTGTTLSSDGVADNGVTDAKLRDSAALSVIGRSANSTGDPGDIAAGSDGHVLRRSGTTLGFGTVATAGIADAAVTLAKIQDATNTKRVIGRNSIGSGDFEEVTVSQLLDWAAVLGAAQGDILYRDSTGWAVLAAGTSGRFLKTQGASANPTWADAFTAATQAEQETGSSTTAPVTPGRQQYHASAAKAWVRFNGSGVVSINASYNVSSITDNGAGDWTVNFTTAFSSTNYCGIVSGGGDNAPGTNYENIHDGATASPTTSAFRISGTKQSGGSPTASDFSRVHAAFFGDQ